MTFAQWFLKIIGIAICTDINAQKPLEEHPAPIQGTVVAQIEQQRDNLPTKAREVRTISLQQVSPDPAFFAAKAQYYPEPDFSKGVIPFDASSTAKELKFEVPVLDQGQYGTCVTFASTATLDALLGGGDLVSQQCSLSLNMTLGYNYWNGAYDSTQIIIPLQKYGVVKQNNCAGVPYPVPYYKIPKSLYKIYVDKNIDVKQIKYQYIRGISIDQVKQAIDEGKYVNIGFGLVNNGSAVAVQGFDLNIYGMQHVGGLWACKQPSDPYNIYCGQFNSGHEVVIIGYDDSQSLLKIRNSWGDKVGDQGDFYMTYSFFEAMVMDGTLIWK